MPAPDQSNWDLRYDDPRSFQRFLFSIPPPMMRDLRVLAGVRETTVAELLRRAAAREVAEFIAAHPQFKISFKGEPCPRNAGPEQKETPEP